MARRSSPARPPSLPELVGDAGLLVDPQDTASISAAMQRLVEDDRLRENLIQKGKQQAAKFTWGRAARQLQAIFDEFQRMRYGKP